MILVMYNPYVDEIGIWINDVKVLLRENSIAYWNVDSMMAAGWEKVGWF